MLRPFQTAGDTRLANLNVGFDTYDTAEKLYGRGVTMMGGHPRGARAWRSRETGWVLYIDGFDYVRSRGKEVPVIDQVSIYGPNDSESPGGDFPVVSLSREACTLLQSITIGSSKAAVLEALAVVGIQGEQHANMVSWSTKGKSHINQYATYTKWLYNVKFDGNDKVMSIEISSV